MLPYFQSGCVTGQQVILAQYPLFLLLLINSISLSILGTFITLHVVSPPEGRKKGAIASP